MLGVGINNKYVSHTKSQVNLASFMVYYAVTMNGSTRERSCHVSLCSDFQGTLELRNIHANEVKNSVENCKPKNHLRKILTLHLAVLLTSSEIVHALLDTNRAHESEVQNS